MGQAKTFTALKIAEDLVGADGRVLFLVPSLALMAQTVREWSHDSTTPSRSFAVCSDTQVGKRRLARDDVAEINCRIWHFLPPPMQAFWPRALPMRHSA